ncbi:hypothetical protein DAE56_26340 [Salmonella enterica]|nr:hypothetical protein [Salmonella enterica]
MFGLYLEDEYGHPWATDFTKNMQLVAMREHNGVQLDSFIDTGVANGKPFILFWQIVSGDLNHIPRLFYRETDKGNWQYFFTQGRDGRLGNYSSVHTRVFIFSDYATHLPKYGVAFWDENNNLLATNESRLLRIEGTFTGKTLGQRLELAGNYAICADWSGSMGFENAAPGYISSVEFDFAAYYNGRTTVLTNGLAKYSDDDSWGHVSVSGDMFVWQETGGDRWSADIPNSPYIEVSQYI